VSSSGTCLDTFFRSIGTNRYISWAPILDEDPTVCGIPQMYDANKEWAGKKVVIVSVPGKSIESS